MAQRLKVGEVLHLLDDDAEVFHFATPACAPLRKLIQSACEEQGGITWGDPRWVIDVPVGGEGRPVRRIEIGKNRQDPHGPDLLGFRLDGTSRAHGMVEALGRCVGGTRRGRR